MNLVNLIAQIQSELVSIVAKQENNRQNQQANHQRINQLEEQLKQFYALQGDLDSQAIEFFREAEELKNKLNKLEKIAAVQQQFEQLIKECQDTPELLDTLYESIIFIPENAQSKRKKSQSNNNVNPFNSETHTTLEPKEVGFFREEDIHLTEEGIKTVFPRGELVYQQLLENYPEQYKTYQSYVVDGLNMLWYAVAFIAKGRELYRQLSRQYHPDLKGSAEAMQLINAAWEISQDYLSVQ